MGLLDQSKVFLRDMWGPWPVPSARYPLTMPPAVARIAWMDYLDLGWHVVSRLKWENLAYRPLAYLYAKTHPGLEPVSDFEFDRLLTQTVLSRFLNPQIDTVDRGVFSQYIKQKSSGWYKMDFTLMNRLMPFPGLYVAPTVTLFKRGRDGSLRAVAIKINGLVVTPKNKQTWNLAKYFVLQGASYHMVLGIHPWVHFPMDVIIAVSLGSLPKQNLLYKLILPHSRFTLALNNRVLEHPRTVVNNSQEEVYTPYTAPGASIRSFMSGIYMGLPGNSSFPGYHFSTEPPQIDSPYGDFLSGYYEVIFNFVKKVVRGIKKNDRLVIRWADELSRWLKGFPDGKNIFEKDILARVLTMFIWNVSVVHSADHQSYSSESIRKSPLRLRVPPPDKLQMKQVEPDQMVSEEDLFRHKMSHEMFFKPHNISLFCTTDYQFNEKELIFFNTEFLANLKSYDLSLTVPRYIKLKEISRSIQY